MIDYKTKITARFIFKDCTHFSKGENGFVQGVMMGKCDKCLCDTIDWTTPWQLLSDDMGKMNMSVVCKDIGLKLIDVNDFRESSNVEDFSKEYQCVCNECASEIMDEYYESHD